MVSRVLVELEEFYYFVHKLYANELGQSENLGGHLAKPADAVINLACLLASLIVLAHCQIRTSNLSCSTRHLNLGRYC